MKRLSTKLIMILSLLSLVGCESEKPGNEPGHGSDKIPITIASNLTDLTKVTNNAYESGDKLGVYVVNQTSQQENGTLENQGNHVDNMDFTLSKSGWTPSQTIYWKDNSTKAEFYCYQPFSSGNLNVSAHPFSIQTNQDAGDGYKKSDFTWGKTAALAPTQGDVAIQTKHILSNVLIYIEAGKGFTAEQIEGFSKSVTLIVKPSCVINLASGNVSSSAESVGVTPKTGDGFYSVIVPPQTVNQDDVCLKIVMNGQTFELSKTIVFAAGKQHRLTATLNQSGSGSISVGLSDWETGDEIKIDGGAKRVAHSGGVIDVKVTSNASYEVEIPDQYKSWITQLSTKNSTTQTLSFDVKPNTGTDSREGAIIFRNSANGSVIETVVVQQSSLLATSVHVDVPGTLGYLVEADVAATLTTLIVSGNIVADDFYFIRDAMPELETLDISQTNISLIPDNAFQGYSSVNNSYALTKLTTLKLPKTVISIGVNAYSYLQNFETFDVSTVLVIRPSAFSYCRSLTSIDFNPNLRVLGYYAFQGCTSLASIHIPEAIEVIGSMSFQDCKSLKSVTFAPQAKLTNIDMMAFIGCSSLETIEIPVGVTSLGSSAFNNCTSLRSVTFAPQSELSIIESGAFTGCSSLESIEIPSGVTDINNAFSGTPLKAITIPAGVTSLKNAAFQNCKSLKLVTFAPQSKLANIEQSVFSGCSLLESIEIPSEVTSLTNYVFQNCTSLKIVTFAPQSKLEVISSYAFSDCTSLETVELPSGVIDIGNAFKSSSIKSFEIPSGMASLENYAFQNCKSLKSVTCAPQSQLTTIGSNVFYGCSLLEAIEIPAGVISLGSNAFDDCASLNTVTCYAVTPPTISSSIFDDTPTTKILKVPAGSVSAYKANSYWSAAFNEGNNIQAI